MDLRNFGTGSGRFSSALSSAVFEWILILLLFIEASICYLVTKFSRFCELQPPCILCSRIDHLLNDEEPRFYLNLICSHHKLEISSLAFCHVHEKLADVNTMCEACLISSATSNKSNAETYRLLVGKLGLDFNHIIEDNQLSADGDDLYVIRGDDVAKGILKEECMPSCSITRNCSCCYNPFKLKPHGVSLLGDESVGSTLHEKEIPAEGLHGLSNIHAENLLDKRKEWSINSSATQLVRDQGVDPFSEVQYSKVEITSDSESEVPASDDDNGALPLRADKAKEAFSSVLPDSEPLVRENTSAALTDINVGNIMPAGADNVNKVLASALAESEPLILMQDYNSAPLSTDDNRTHVAIDNAKVFASVDPESEPLIHVEDNWPASFQSYIAQETLNDHPSHLLNASEQLPEDQLHAMENPEPLASSSSRKDLEETCGNLTHGEAYSSEFRILSQDEEVSSKKDNLRSIDVANSTATPLDLKNWNSNEVNWETAHDRSESGPSMSTHMDLYGEEDYTVLDNISKLLATKKNELCFESRKGSIASDIEGQITFERLRCQIELEQNSISLLREELENERNAAADAANQAMAIITMLQEEKATLQTALLQNQIEITKESSISPTFADILLKKDSFKLQVEDERVLVRQISVVPEVESPTPRVYGEEEEDTVSYNVSNFLRPMDKNESAFESREGSIVGETEGEATVEKLKCQNELDRKSISFLQEELEEERNAAADAAEQAIAMITKLQEEKAALQMMVLQYQREITRESSISPTFANILVKKDTFKLREEDERVLVRQISALPEVKPPTPRVYGEEEGTVSYDISNFLRPMDKNESAFESRDGSIASETEGEATVEKLKCQNELDRKSISLLQEELEEERNAAAYAAEQAMAMITKLQEEKAALQMAALQNQREITRESSISPTFADILMKKDSFKLQEEDERILVCQISAVTEAESPTPRVYEEEEDTVSRNISNLRPMDKSESGFESREGSIVSETEGEATVEKLKRQIELDRKSISLLQEEIEEERNASADAADQAMAMITKLQEEKAALQMAALQYQREMEEQAEYHLEELGMCQEELAEKEQQIQDLEADLESLQYHIIAESPSNRILEKLNSHNYKILKETNYISGESGSLKNPLLSLEDEKAYISDHLTKLEKKLHHFSKNGVYPDDSGSDVDEDGLPNGNLARTRGEDGTQLCRSSESDIRTNGHYTGEIRVTGGSAHSQHDDSIQENSKLGVFFEGNEIDGIYVNANGEDCAQFYNVSESDARINGRYSDVDAITRSSHYTHQEELIKLTSSSGLLNGTEMVHESNHHKLKNKIEYAGKRNDCGSLDDEVSHLRQRLEALELDRNILEHAITALKNGEDGVRLIQEIASSLRELKRIGDLQQKHF